MKRELALHFISTLILLVLIVLFKRWFSLAYWPLIAGGILGTFLPDIDHLIYVYFTGPQELTSQRVVSLVGKSEVIRTISLLYETRSERKGLIFHSFYFQILFWVLTFLVVSSSGSVFGRGLVTAFALHLIVDEYLDLKQTGSLANWFSQTGIVLPQERETLYLAANAVVLLILSVLV